MNRALPVSAILAGLLVIVADGPAPAQVSPYVALTDKAPSSWSLAPAKVDTKIMTDRDYKFSTVAKDLNGGTLLVRPSADHAHWLAPGSVTAKKDGTVYAVIRTKYLNKPVFPAASLKKLEGDGWTEIEGEVATTFPGNENWEWTAFKKEIKKGEVDLELKGIKWNTRSAVLFVFK